MKTLKLPEQIHKELKIYVAQNPSENMSEVAEVAITEELKKRGHKFTKIVKREKALA